MLEEEDGQSVVRDREKDWGEIDVVSHLTIDGLSCGSIHSCDLSIIAVVYSVFIEISKYERQDVWGRRRRE